MANEQQKKKAEDFRKQQSGEQNASPDEALAATSSSNEESSSISQDDDFATTTTSSSPEKSSAQTTMDEAIGLAAACTSVKLNDLVADLCITSSTSAGASSNSQPAAALRSQVVPPVNNASSGSSYGDYTNIRATTTLKASATRLNDMSTCVADSSTESCSSAAPPPTQQQPAAAPVQNSSSSFSFKHFLNSSNSVTAPSTTVTSLDPIGSGGSTATATTTSVATTGSATSSTTVMTSTVPTSTSTTTTSSSSLSFQSSTGARPKVPQSASVSGSMMQHTSSSNTLCADISTSSSKMKRSPRFSSFDSQASLAEYAGAPLDGFISCSQTLGGHNRRGGTADLDADGAEDYFSSSHYSSMRGPAASSSDCPLDFDTRQGVPRSLTNFDFQTSSSPRRRVGANQSRRPTRLALNYASGGGGMVTSTSSSSSSKMKLDLPFENAATNYAAAPSTSAAAAAAASLAAASMSPSSSGGAAGGLPATASSSRSGGLGDYQPAAAAALPDFVQDHWLDSWYAHDAHLSSPPNSPIHEFVDDIGVVGAAGGHAEAAVAAACLNSNEALALGGAGVGLNLSVSGVGGVVGSSSNGSQVSSAAAANESATVGSKMLPDFLSDGPIIHSSQRLADVAVGLPSNSMGSPDDSHLATQLSRLLSENEHLHREVSDMRSALQEQTRRANDLERMLQEQQRREQVKANEQQQQQMYGGKLTSDEMILMQLQMANMRGEIERLRYENALLREEGAVGGAPADSPVNHRPTAASTASASSKGAAGAAAAASSANSSAAGSGGASTSAGARNNSARPSKTQQQQQQQQHLQNQNLSRDLRLAATTAETHLRQLLAGVDNLRQMATQIDSGDCALDYNVSPDLFTDYPVQCFDYDEYAGTTS